MNISHHSLVQKDFTSTLFINSAFLQTKEVTGRCFILLTNNGDDESDEICMDASSKDFMNWKSNDIVFHDVCFL